MKRHSFSEMGHGVEFNNMPRDERKHVLDVGMRKGGEKSKAAAHYGVRGCEAGSSW